MENTTNVDKLNIILTCFKYHSMAEHPILSKNLPFTKLISPFYWHVKWKKEFEQYCDK